MARAHEIAIAADAKEFDQGIRDGVIKPLEKAEEALEDLADAADDAGRDGSRSIEKLEDALKDAQRESRDLGEKMTDAGDKAKRGMKDAEEGVKGFKDEAMQSARETAASFDGSFESIADLGQEVAANAFADFGPLGAAAGIAVAAGAGVMVDSFNKVEEAATEARDSAFSLAYDVAGALESAGYTARIGEWTSDTEKFKQVFDLATVSGWEQVDVIDALASGGPKLGSLTDAVHANGQASWLTTGRLSELDAVLRSTNEGYISGADAALLAERANYQYAMTVGVATGETDELGNAIYRLPDDTEVAVNAQTQQATEDIKRLDDDIAAVPDTVHTSATFDAGSAQRDLDNWVFRNDGRTIRVRGRVEIESGASFE
ncbi:hypothetical protein ASF87_16725 [Microbacterium sp. Leaf161]|uniref:hypothetical protein n=1 Tax=Microbacterium sp. Leaf161 TaxID=1736281 RepID=UPI0006F36F74|nr:hypothetical protein [Microbacterium sp. Leaf161]KQR43434.1 hypothetical protein ASF87_16725 [Microbacterium sp. Leaf161]